MSGEFSILMYFVFYDPQSVTNVNTDLLFISINTTHTYRPYGS
jgi:hypothetical protein